MTVRGPYPELQAVQNLDPYDDQQIPFQLSAGDQYGSLVEDLPFIAHFSYDNLGYCFNPLERSEIRF
jgi:hypothetical protein